MYKKYIPFIALFCLLFGANLQAQSGAIDASFNTFDGGLGNGDGADNNVLGTAVQADGKIILGGSFLNYNGVAYNRILRVNSDGSPDASFTTGTAADNLVRAIVVQPDGKILVGGDFTSFNGSTRNRIVRLNTDGTIDPSFTAGTAANNAIRTIVLQSDGKILIGGDFTTYNGTGRNRVARLNTDGTLDVSFAPGTAANNIVYAIAVQTDGNIVIGGNFTTYNGTARVRMARITTTGALDASFTPGTGANVSVNACVLQSDGKVVIAGGFTSYNGTAINRIARLNTNGTLDATYTVGTGANFPVRACIIQPDGKVIFGGDQTFYNNVGINRIIRLNTDGTWDTSFDVGSGGGNPVYTLSLQTDGKVIVGGTFTYFNVTGRGRIVRLNANGSVDLTMNPGTGANGLIRASVVQPDGKILIGGDFTIYNGVSSNYIARLNADGSLDGSFNVGTGCNGPVYAVALQADGKVVIGGGFSSYNGSLRSRIARLNTNGTLDGTYSNTPTSGANNTVYTIAIQSDGKHVVGGLFTSFNNTGNDRILRLNTDGSTDATFTTGSRANNGVYSIAIQSDGKMLVGGFFTSYNGIAVNRFLRIDANGNQDNTYPVGTSCDGNVHNILLQADGKAILVGAFNNYNGTARSKIARLNTDGTIDNTFNPGTGANNTIFSSALESDGKIIIGGQFTSYNGTGRNFLACVLTNGSLDASFNPGTGSTTLLNSVAVQADGKVLIGGDFTSYDGTGKNRFARVLAPIPCGTVSATTSQTNVPCLTATNGTATVVASGGNSFTYNWLPSGGTSATATGLGVGTYSCTITNECFNTFTATVTIIVANSPTITVTSNPSNGIVCNGTQATLTASGASTYAWSGGITNAVPFTPASSGTYTVVGTDVAGCTASATANINVITCATATVPCGLTFTRFASSVYASYVANAISYRFTFYDNISNAVVAQRTQSSRIITFSNVTGLFYGTTYKWTVAVNTGNGFGAESNPNCTITFGAATATLPCNVTFTNKNAYSAVIAPGAAVNYRITFYDNISNAIVAQTVQSSVYIYFNQYPMLSYGTTYKWTVAAEYNLAAGGTAWGPESSNACTITFAAPQTTVPCGNTYSRSTGYTVATAVSGAIGYRFSFYIGSTLIGQRAQTSNYIYFAQVPGLVNNQSYTWTVEVQYQSGSGPAYGPPSSSACTVTFGANLTTLDKNPEESTFKANENAENELAETAFVEVFPNPAQDKVFIRSSEPIENIMLYNLNGALLGQYNSVYEIDLLPYTAGTYFLMIQTASGVSRQTIIKE